MQCPCVLTLVTHAICLEIVSYYLLVLFNRLTTMRVGKEHRDASNSVIAKTTYKILEIFISSNISTAAHTLIAAR